MRNEKKEYKEDLEKEYKRKTSKKALTKKQKKKEKEKEKEEVAKILEEIYKELCRTGDEDSKKLLEKYFDDSNYDFNNIDFDNDELDDEDQKNPQKKIVGLIVKLFKIVENLSQKSKELIDDIWKRIYVMFESRMFYANT